MMQDMVTVVEDVVEQIVIFKQSHNATMFVSEASRPVDGLKIFCCSNWTYSVQMKYLISLWFEEGQKAINADHLYLYMFSNN